MSILRLIDVHTIKHFIYIKTKKKTTTKKTALSRLKFKKIFFYIYL